ncbi:MAG: PhnD/SsuA/transferrin family substrate-binding protein [Rhizobiales bacterium]|nr:PhnD/SsuA/transferrin family substrate-binding protein [Hyphomicrobiales bacterium]
MSVISNIMPAGRRLRVEAACLLAVGALFAASVAPVKGEPTKIRIGYDTIPLHIVPVIFRMPELQKHNGKEYALEFFRFKGSPLQVQALAANEVDIAALAFSTFATSITTAKLPIKGIADLAQDGPWYSQAFAVKKDSPITKVEDLKGKTLAINAFGGATDMAARVMMVKHGLTPDKDVRIIEASFGAMPAMVRSGKVDVASFPAPVWSVHSKAGDLRTLFRQSDALGDQQFLLYAAKDEFIKKNRKALVAFYEDYLRGLKAVVDPKNRQKVLETISKVAGSPVKNFEDWALLEGKDYYHSPDGKINVKALQSNIKSLKDLGLLKQTLEVVPHIDHSLLDEAAKRL